MYISLCIAVFTRKIVFVANAIGSWKQQPSLYAVHYAYRKCAKVRTPVLAFFYCVFFHN